MTTETNIILRALNLADGLMAHDPDDPLRAPYTRANAELAVIDGLELKGDDREAFLRIMAVKHGS